MDLTDEQWEVLEPLIPIPTRRVDGKGRPWREPRDVLNGILWISIAAPGGHSCDILLSCFGAVVAFAVCLSGLLAREDPNHGLATR